ncbi:phosphatase PAP2 family protein [Arenimonas sp.]|uniref:phosphatase PAP2 family protein n=1 Tax=Arenimonas sp. TaxID=1872635 RepID=UPI0039E2F4A5
MSTVAARLSEREQAWCRAANRWGARRAVCAYFRFVSRLGDGAFWYALMALVAFVDEWRGLGAAAHLAATGGIAAILYRQLKRWTKRPRPFATDARIQAWIAPLDEFSFPSGHTLHAVSFSLVALAYYPMLAWLLLPFALSVAVSRVVLGMHYPSDVLAAAAIGTGLASLSLWLVPGASLLG